MSERVVDEGQSWASDIIGVVSGVGLYSVLFFETPFSSVCSLDTALHGNALATCLALRLRRRGALSIPLPIKNSTPRHVQE